MSNFKKNEGAKFQGIREDAGMSRQEAAKLLGVTEHTVQSWEIGRRKISKVVWEYFLIVVKKGKHKRLGDKSDKS